MRRFYTGAHGADNGLVPEEGQKNKGTEATESLEKTCGVKRKLLRVVGACERHSSLI